MNDDDELLDRLGDALTTPVPEPTPDRIAAIRDAALRAQGARSVDGAASAGETDSSTWSTRRALLLSTAAAAVGAAGGALVVNADQDAPTAAPGPPTEALSFSSSDASTPGSTVGGKTINHTWGVELLLDATGFPVGSRYRVVYVDTADEHIEAGGFVGAELPIHCRCNAALLRTDITAIEIRDADDRPVSRAEFT